MQVSRNLYLISPAEESSELFGNKISNRRSQQLIGFKKLSVYPLEGMVHGLIALMILYQDVIFVNESSVQHAVFLKENSDSFKNFLAKIFVVCVGITRYQYRSYTNIFDLCLLGLMSIFLSPSTLVVYSFYISSDLSIIYRIFKMVAIMGFCGFVLFIGIVIAGLCFSIALTAVAVTMVTDNLLLSFFFVVCSYIVICAYVSRSAYFDNQKITIYEFLVTPYFFLLRATFSNLGYPIGIALTKDEKINYTVTTRFGGTKHALYSMPTLNSFKKNAPKSEQLNYCFTVAMAFALKIIPSSYLASDWISEVTDVRDIVAQYLAFGTMLANQMFDCVVTKVVHKGVSYSPNIFKKSGQKNGFSFWEDFNYTGAGNQLVKRFDVRAGPALDEVQIVSLFTEQLGFSCKRFLTVKEYMSSEPNALIVVIDQHAYLNVAVYNSMQVVEKNQTATKIKTESQNIPEPVQKQVKHEDVKLTFMQQLEDYKTNGYYAIFGDQNRSAIISQQGSFTLEDNLALMNSSLGLIDFPVCSYPIDYNLKTHKVLDRVQICFEMWLVKIDGPLNTKEVAPYYYRQWYNQYRVDLAIGERIKQVLSGLVHSSENIKIVKNRYLEYFNSHCKTEFKLNVCNDIYGEYDALVQGSLLKVIYDMDKQQAEAAKLLSLKKEWWKILLACENLQFLSRYAAKDQESMQNYVQRHVPAAFGEVVTSMILSWLLQDEELISHYIVKYTDMCVDTLKHQLRETSGVLFDRLTAITTFVRSKAKIGSIQNIFYHKSELECYDLTRVSPRVLKSMKFYHPVTRQLIGIPSAQEILDIYGPYCQCSKNIGKKKVDSQQNDLPQELCFGSYGKCPLNAIAAIVSRQAASLLQPDRATSKKFLAWYKRQNVPQKFVEAMDKLDKNECTFEAYLNHIRITDPKKAEKYKQGRISALLVNSIDYVMGCFPKVGEWFLQRKGEDMKQKSNRSRNICNPSDQLLGTANHVNYIGLKLLKIVCPEYQSYKNNDELIDSVDKGWRHISKYGAPCAVSADFSSHDSNQHTEYIEHIDNQVWFQLLPAIYGWLDLPQRLYDAVLKGITGLETKLGYKIQIGRKFRKVFDVTISGTVTSGHPTRTTWGNTLRVVHYYKYVFDQLGIEHYRMYVGGDDFYAILTQQDSRKLQKNFGMFFSRTMTGEHGLGQCAKKINFLGNKVDFLSKIGVVRPSGTNIFRQIPRIAYLQRFSSSRIQDLQVLKKAMACAYYCSGWNFTYIKNIVKTIGVNVQGMTLAKNYENISQYLDVPMTRFVHYVSHVFKSITPSYGEDYDLIECSTQVGDLAGISRSQLEGLLLDASNDRYEHLTKYKDGHGQEVGNNKTYVETYGNISVVHGKLQESLTSRSMQKIGRVNKNNTNKHDVAVQRKNRSSLENAKPVVKHETTVRKVQKDTQKQREQQKIGMQKQYVRKSNQQQISGIPKQQQQQQQQQHQVKQKQRTILGPMRQTGPKNKEKQAKKRQLMTLSKYGNSVLNPFTTQAVRGPNDYCQPTSLYEYKFVIDYNTDAQLQQQFVIYPHNISNRTIQGNSGAYAAYFNGYGSAAGAIDTSIYFLTSGITPAFNRAIYHPFGSYTSLQNDPDDGGRFTSARVVRTGVKIYPTSNITVRQGMLTIGMVPGKTKGFTDTSVIMPSSQRLRQYPTSYEIQLANIPQTGTDYVWVPLDPLDMVFMGGDATRDGDSVAALLRNPIYANFDNIAAGDRYRIEIVSTLEYIPSMNFVEWSVPQLTSTTDSDFKQFTSVVKSSLPKAQSGTLGHEISRLAGNIGSMISDKVSSISMLDVAKFGMSLI